MFRRTKTLGDVLVDILNDSDSDLSALDEDSDDDGWPEDNLEAVDDDPPESDGGSDDVTRGQNLKDDDNDHWH